MDNKKIIEKDLHLKNTPNKKETIQAGSNNELVVNKKYDKFKYNFFERLFYTLIDSLAAIPDKIYKLIVTTIPLFFVNLWKKLCNEVIDVYQTFKKGDFKTRLSFIIMGFGLFFRGQILRGILFIAFEILFIFYMIFFGWKYLSQMGRLGDNLEQEVEIDGEWVYIQGDNSTLILLYSLITIFFIVAFIYVWRLNVKQNKISQELIEIGIKPKRAKDDIKSIGDSEYHKTLLAFPTFGLVAFTILPMIFMVLISFTNFDKIHEPPARLFDWVGFDNFVELLGGGLSTNSALFFYTFKQVLLWTIIWAIFATFSNYFLGMVVAMLINKKGIKLKKLWRSILIVTIAVPQFVSLLILNRMLQDNGIVNMMLEKVGFFNFLSDLFNTEIVRIPFMSNATWARITVIVVNIWVGIPYTMLICTGILMNIPEDLYESAKIDGASPFRMYMKITLPYMLFVTGPYLLNQFIGNINNFNVIYLLTGGNPGSLDYQFAGQTDLLITWLYKLTVDDRNFKLASVIGILVFVIIATISLIFYSRSNAIKNEEDFR